MVILILAAAAALIVSACLYMIWPSRERRRAAAWIGTPFAHRGLHGEGIPENTLAAFKKAADSGFGMELDVRYTKDKKIVVCHDDSLRRVMGVDADISALTREQLHGYVFPGTRETVPEFSDVLKTVAGRTPLLVEVKTCPDVESLTRDTVALLEGYKGKYVMESFDPYSLRVLKKEYPHIIRGQLVTSAKDYGRGLKGILLSGLLADRLSRPDFIAYNRKMKDSLPIRLQRRFFRTPLAVWTIRSENDAVPGDMNIFEGFIPAHSDDL